MSFNQLVVGSNPTRPTISKIWKAHENEDFRIFFCFADLDAWIAALSFLRLVGAVICKTGDKSFEAEGRHHRLSQLHTHTSSRLSRNIAPASGDVKLQWLLLAQNRCGPRFSFILIQCSAAISR
ncbi:hypothetical protein [Pseudomonas amygdali]|uniref:hypothetical protein n=1 Tax=Pseudomonas amygdali TaxID=47877 RepID=UPI001111BB00|nr:hypothetical protein [Pseudomonas amygdali]